MCIQNEWVFELTTKLMEEYWVDYQRLHPKAKNHPLKANNKIKKLSPHPLSQNQTIIMRRPQANATKQKWSDFVCWWVKKLGYDNLQLEHVKVYIEFYFGDKRERDIIDNYNLKYISDGFVRSGFLKDDNCFCVQKAIYEFKGIDKNNPRTVIRFVRLKEEEVVK